MHLIGLARLGRDAEIRFLQDGTPVANLALAFNYGKKGDDGNRPTQWVDAAFFGDRANKLSQYLTKGTQLQVHLSDPHIETYPKNGGGEGFKLVARVDHIEFAGGNRNDGQQAQGQQRPAQQPGASADEYRNTRNGTGTQQRRPAPNFDDMDDDIPF